MLRHPSLASVPLALLLAALILFGIAHPAT
jgi:hypothetical protein